MAEPVYKIPHDGKWRLQKAKMALQASESATITSDGAEQLMGVALVNAVIAIAEALYQ